MNKIQIRFGLYDKQTGKLAYTIVANFDEQPDFEPTNVIDIAKLENLKRDAKLAIVDSLYDLKVVEED